MNEYPRTEDMLESLADEPMPPRLHAKIMKRVFLAEYGKYLVFSASILVVNAAILAVDLYKTFTDVNASALLKKLGESFAVTPSYFAQAAGTLYDVLPVQSIVATAFTIGLAAYIALIFARNYKNPGSIQVKKTDVAEL